MITEARMAIAKRVQKRNFFSSIIKQFISAFTLSTFIFSQGIFVPLYAQDGAQPAADQTAQPQIQEISAEDAEAQQQASASGQIQSPAYQPPEETTTQDFMTDDSALSASDEKEELIVDSGELAEKKLAEAEGEVVESEPIKLIAPSMPVAPPVIATTEEEKAALTRSTIASSLKIGDDEKFEIKQIYSNDAISMNYQTGEQSIDSIYRVTKSDGSILYASVYGAQVAGGITQLSAGERTDGKYFDRELQNMEVKTISLAPAPIKLAAPIAPAAPPVIAGTVEEQEALTRGSIATALGIGEDATFDIKLIYSNDAIMVNPQTGEQQIDEIYRVTKSDGSVAYAGVNGARVADGITSLSAGERTDGKYFDKELQVQTIKAISIAPAPQPEPAPMIQTDPDVMLEAADFEKRISALSEITLADFQTAQKFLGAFEEKEAYENLVNIISRKIVVVEVAGTKVKVFPTGLIKIVDDELSNLPDSSDWLPGLTEKDFIAAGAMDDSLESDLSMVLYMVSHYGEYFVKDGEVDEGSFRQWLRGENLEQTNAPLSQELARPEPEVMESEPVLPVKDGERNVEPEVMESDSDLKVPDESKNVVEPEVMEEPLVDTAAVDGQKEVQEMFSLLESDHNEQISAIGAKYSERLKTLRNKFADQSEISLEEYNNIESMIFSIREEYETEKKNYLTGRDKISQYAASKNIPFLLDILPMESRRGITFANEDHRNIENGVDSLLASKSVGIQLKEGSVLHVNPALISDLIYRTRRDFGVQFGVEGQKLGEVPGITADDSKGVGPSEDEWGTPNERQNYRVALNVVERLGASIATKDGLVNSFALRKALFGGKSFENVSIEEDAERNVRVVVKPNFGDTKVAYIAGTEPAFMTMNAKDKKVKIGDKTFDISSRDNVVSALQAINDSIDSNPLDRSSSEGDWRMVIEKFQDFVKTNSPASEKAREVVAAFRASLSSGGASGIPAERPGSFSSADRDRERKESSLAERKANRISLFELWQKQKRSKLRSSGTRISGFDE